MKRGLKGRRCNAELARQRGSRDFPDEEGTEREQRRTSDKLSASRSRDFPDEEGTESSSASFPAANPARFQRLPR